MSNTKQRIRQAVSLSIALLLPLLTGCEILPKLQPLPSNVLTPAAIGNNSIILARMDCRLPLPPQSPSSFLYGGGECRDLGPMAKGRRAQVDRPCLRQELVLDLRAHLPNRRHSAAAPATFQACADASRA